MDRKTIEKLQKNPFYEFSPKQKLEIINANLEPTVQYGQVETNVNEFKTHPVKVCRKGCKKNG